jgi:hypothetical protein
MIKAAALAALFLCAAGSALAQQQQQTNEWPFPVARGSAMPPPAAAPGQTAPPEGPAAGGLDFGQWRSTDPARYEPAFQSAITQRLAGKSSAQVRSDLEANGFACEDTTRLDCRIEITEQQCAIDWYVVVERARAEPIAGFEHVCLGAR